MDWQIPWELQRVRVRERSLEGFKKAVKQGTFGRVLGTVAELRPQLTVAETRAQKLREQIANFQVLDSYRNLSSRAARTKTEMQSISYEAVTLGETLDHLESALEAERPPARSDLQSLYAAAGVELPGVALRRFEDVNKFYDSIIENRRAHLQDEITGIRKKLADGEQTLATLDAERSEIFRTLQGRGALEDFLQLQKTLAEYDATAASLRERFQAAEILEGEVTQLEIDRNNLKRRLQEDHQQRRAVLDEVILLVA